MSHEQYPDEGTYYPQVRNPMNSNTNNVDEETSLLSSTSAHGGSPLGPTPTSSSSYPSWMPSVGATTTAPRVQAYPQLDSAEGREMSTFSTNQRTQAYPAPMATTYPLSSSAASQPAPRPVSVPVAAGPPPPPREVTMIQVESTFIEDLIAENSRLTSEVEDLRKIMQVIISIMAHMCAALNIVLY
jgi:hypothetical protein